MKVALDATPLTEPTGGIRRYTVELANALAALYPQDEYVLISDQSYQHPQMDGVRCETQARPLWWGYGLSRWMREQRVDLFHGTDFSVPYLPMHPAVMTVHDLSPWRFPDASSRVRNRTPWLLRFGLAAMVITPSEAVRQEVVEHFGLSAEEVEAVPLAASSHFRPSDKPRPRRPYFLYAGTVEPRKNLEVVIAAWRRLRPDAELWIGGRQREGYRIDLDEIGIRLLGEIPEADLPVLYSRATAVLYPSLYEGFGLPVIEAMQCGAMVLASNDAAVREVSGGACLLADPKDASAWAQMMRIALIESPAWKERSLRRASEFSWECTARMTHDVYDKAMRRYHG